MLRASLCLCVCPVPWVCVADVWLNGLPEAAKAKFCQGVLTYERVSPLPPNTLVYTLQRVDNCGLTGFWKEGDWGSLRSHLGLWYLDPLLKNSTGLEL